MLKKINRRYIFIGGALLVIIIIGCLLFASRAARQAQATTQTGEIVQAFIGDLSSTASASGQVTARRESRLTLRQAGQVEQLYVAVGDEVAAGDLLLQLETAALERSVASAEQNLIIQQANLDSLLADPGPEEIAASEAAVNSAQAQLDDLLDGPGEAEIAAAQSNIDAAQANVWAASAQVGQTSSGATPAEIAAAQQQVALSQQQYQQALSAHERTLECFDGPDGGEVCPLLGPVEESARYNLQVAEANLATAQAQLDALSSGPNQDALSGAQANVSAASAQQNYAEYQLDILLLGAGQSQIASAEATLAQAEANHAALIRGADQQQLAVAQAQVAQAQISLEEARDNLANAALTAPFDGIITAVHVSEGEIASGLVIEMIDTGTLEVILNVDEIDIGTLAVNQEAIITLESWPDVEIQSQVVSIAPIASAGADSAVVTYQVHLTLGQSDLPIRIGMTANASLITANREDVLLVPNAAIIADRANGTYSVNLVSTSSSGSQTVTEIPVTIGLRDNQYTQISSGLQAGDEIAIGNILPIFSFGGGPGDNDGGGGGIRFGG